VPGVRAAGGGIAMGMYDHLRRPLPAPPVPTPPVFDPRRDGEALAQQRAQVFALMRDGEWRTLGEVSYCTGVPEASASARLRDFRKLKYGGHHVARRSRVGRLYEYRLTLREAADADARHDVRPQHDPSGV
jgi:hypothetical protein